MGEVALSTGVCNLASGWTRPSGLEHTAQRSLPRPPQGRERERQRAADLQLVRDKEERERLKGATWKPQISALAQRVNPIQANGGPAPSNCRRPVLHFMRGSVLINLSRAHARSHARAHTHAPAGSCQTPNKPVRFDSSTAETVRVRSPIIGRPAIWQSPDTSL